MDKIDKIPLSESKSASAKECILVVQPDLSERRILQLALGGTYAFSFAGEVDTALQILGNFQCKVVIVDVGIASTQKIAEISRFKAGVSMERPIIVLTSNNSLEIERKIAAIGVFYHLLRPYSVHDLADLIEAALRYWQRTFGWTKAGNAK